MTMLPPRTRPLYLRRRQRHPRQGLLYLRQRPLYHLRPRQLYHDFMSLVVVVVVISHSCPIGLNVQSNQSQLLQRCLPVATKDLLISPWFSPYICLSRSRFSTLATRQLRFEFYLHTFSRFPLRTISQYKNPASIAKNRTRDFRTSRCARLPSTSLGRRGLNS